MWGTRPLLEGPNTPYELNWLVDIHMGMGQKKTTTGKPQVLVFGSIYQLVPFLGPFWVRIFDPPLAISKLLPS